VRAVGADPAELEGELLVDAVVANQLRSQLTSVEEALACRRLRTAHGLTVKGIAQLLQRALNAAGQGLLPARRRARPCEQKGEFRALPGPRQRAVDAKKAALQSSQPNGADDGVAGSGGFPGEF
jgi:hypothetical protein